MESESPTDSPTPTATPPPVNTDSTLPTTASTIRTRSSSYPTTPLQSTTTYVPVLPEFWSEQPRAWFQQAEAKFRRANITSSQARYDYLLAKLPHDVIVSVLDLLNTITATTPDPYNLLKDRLFATFLPTRLRRANQLLQMPPLGDQRPSALMDAMQALLPPGEAPTDVFHALYLNRLPQYIRDHLATRSFHSMREMAQYADKLWDAHQTPGTPPVAAIAAPAPTRGRQPYRNETHDPLVRSQRRFTYRSPSSRRSSPPPTGNLCFYHARFGSRTRQCHPPCHYSTTICYYHRKFGQAAQKCTPPCAYYA